MQCTLTCVFSNSTHLPYESNLPNQNLGVPYLKTLITQLPRPDKEVAGSKNQVLLGRTRSESSGIEVGASSELEFESRAESIASSTQGRVQSQIEALNRRSADHLNLQIPIFNSEEKNRVYESTLTQYTSLP